MSQKCTVARAASAKPKRKRKAAIPTVFAGQALVSDRGDEEDVDEDTDKDEERDSPPPLNVGIFRQAPTTATRVRLAPAAPPAPSAPSGPASAADEVVRPKPAPPPVRVFSDMAETMSAVISERVEAELQRRDKERPMETLYDRQRASYKALHDWMVADIQANKKGLSPEDLKTALDTENRIFANKNDGLRRIEEAELREKKAAEEKRNQMRRPGPAARHFGRRKPDVKLSEAELRAAITEHIKEEVIDEFLTEAGNVALRQATARKMRRIEMEETAKRKRGGDGCGGSEAKRARVET